MTKSGSSIVSFLKAGVAVLALGAAFAPSLVWAQDQEEEEQKSSGRTPQLDPAIAVALNKAYELMQAEQWQPALAELNKLLTEREARMKAFDKATTYELRGSVKANLEDYRGALRDFETALGFNALPPDRVNTLRYLVAQLNFQLGDYQAAINGLNRWIQSAQAAGAKVDCSAYYLLAAAYTQISPPSFRNAVQPAEQSVACLTEPRKANYDLLNLVYSETNESAKRATLLERMINIWPNERAYWTQLSGLYSTTGKDQDAFSVLEVAYRAGLLRNENEIITLVQYYSFFDNPFRGARVLEREMGAGVVKRTVSNLQLLSQLWSQAREHKRAIPVLQEAAKLSDKGELSYRLGQVLLADEQYVAAERALETAISKGGLTQRQAGDCWLLLGNARFAQAGPGDVAKRARAREAFVRAQAFAEARSQAGQWVGYIDAINSTEKAQDELERAQRIEAMRDDVVRVRSQLQTCRLQGRPASECAVIEKRLTEVQADLARLEAGGAAAAPAAPANAENAPTPPPSPATPAEPTPQ